MPCSDSVAAAHHERGLDLNRAELRPRAQLGALEAEQAHVQPERHRQRPLARRVENEPRLRDRQCV